MSTAELFLDDAEVEDFISGTLQDDWLYRIGDEGSELGLCPVITFYIFNTPDEALGLVDEVVSIYKEFESSIIDIPFSLIWHNNSSDWLKPGDPKLTASTPREDAERMFDNIRSYYVGGTECDSPAATARWAIDGVVHCGVGHAYTRFKLTFRNKWYRQHRDEWHAFVKRCIERLKPDHCYSGFEVGNGGFNFLGAYECDVMERICADYFYGMDIDHPGKMGFHDFLADVPGGLPTDLSAGIRTPTWCFLLSPYWQGRLGKSEAEIRAELDDPRIEITAIPYPVSRLNLEGKPALWIRLGELDLYPVDQGVPDLLVKANRLIKPIRCDELRLLTLDPWDDDPNPRFDYQSSLDWMRRFDDDSTWPSADRRKPMAPQPSEPSESPLKGVPGAVVPVSGTWTTPALIGEAGTRHFEAGERFPDVSRSDYGEVIWTLHTDQQ